MSNHKTRMEEYNYKPLFFRFGHMENRLIEFGINKTALTFREKINNRVYKMVDTEESYRVINHWAKEDLLFDEMQVENSSWRKFNLVDLCWLEIIKEARKIGLGLDKLKRLKQIIFGFYKATDDKADRTYFEYAIASVFAKEKVSLVILKDGTGDFGFGDELVHIDHFFHDYKEEEITSFVVVDFNKIVARIIKKKKVGYPDTKALDLEEKEFDLVSKIRKSKDGDEIKVKLKNKQIDKVDFKTKKLNPENAMNEVRDFFKGDTDKEIVLKKVNGKVVMVEQVIKT